ncbi:MAG: hypothetical protein ACQEP1_04880 [Nanobdellota archaeon]
MPATKTEKEFEDLCNKLERIIEEDKKSYEKIKAQGDHSFRKELRNIKGQLKLLHRLKKKRKKLSSI